MFGQGFCLESISTAQTANTWSNKVLRGSTEDAFVSHGGLATQQTLQRKRNDFTYWVFSYKWLFFRKKTNLLNFLTGCRTQQTLLLSHAMGSISATHSIRTNVTH